MANYGVLMKLRGECCAKNLLTRSSWMEYGTVFAKNLPEGLRYQEVRIFPCQIITGVDRRTEAVENVLRATE